MVETFQSLNLSSSTPQIEKLLISFVSSGNGDVMLTNTAYADNLYSPAPLLSAVWSDAWLWRQNTNQVQVTSIEHTSHGSRCYQPRQLQASIWAALSPQSPARGDRWDEPIRARIAGIWPIRGQLTAPGHGNGSKTLSRARDTDMTDGDTWHVRDISLQICHEDNGAQCLQARATKWGVRRKLEEEDCRL